MCVMRWVSSVTRAPGRIRQVLPLTAKSGTARLFSCPQRTLGLSLLAALALSTSGCAWLDAKQRSIIYRPTPGIPADFAGLRPSDERYFLSVPALAGNAVPPAGQANAATTPNPTASPAQIEMWWLPHSDPAAPTLLYYHGTFRNLYQNLPKINALREAGFAILAVEYRGWGRSTAIVPSEQTIVQDAQIAFNELQRRELRASQRFIYGHSMGSGVAVEIASRLTAPAEYGALILESAFTSFPDIATEASFLGRLVSSFNNERFASIDKIGKVQAPLLMMHGSADKTVPVQLGKKLFAAATSPKIFVEFEAGRHSDLQDADTTGYQKSLRDFRNKYAVGR
jgi:uncharacterized protein